MQLSQLQEKIADFLHDDVLRKLEFTEWDPLIAYLSKNTPKNRIYFVIDEFSYLVKNNQAILSVLQKYWDTELNSSEMVLILTGSMLGLMSEQVLSHTSPLYGRRTLDILLSGMQFEHARKFLTMDPEQALRVYLAIGGIPEYLDKANGYKNSETFIIEEFMHKYGYFYREPYYMLSQDLKEIKNYFSILNAIAYGNTKPTEIANFVGIGAREIYPYLENLQRLSIIEREVSIYGNTKKGIYVIKDQVFDFWFNFVFKNREEIEIKKGSPEKKHLNTYYGKKFEKFVLQEIIPKIYPNNTKKGRWWDKEKEIDILVEKQKEQEIILIEVKWSEIKERKAKEILNKLQLKAMALDKQIKGKKILFGLIAKTIEKKEELKKDGYEIYDLEEILAL